MTQAHPNALKPEQLRRTCNLEALTFRDTSELPPVTDAIGQARAARAIAFGIDIESEGYHVYALGPSGTGKTSMIETFLRGRAAERPAPDDWCYVHNFIDEDKPKALRLPAGKGRAFQADVSELIRELREDIPRLFEGEEYQKQRAQLEDEFRSKTQGILRSLEVKAQAVGFAVVPMPHNIGFAPVINGAMLSSEQIDKLDDATRAKLQADAESLHDEARDILRQLRALERETRERFRSLDRQTASFRMDHPFAELRERYNNTDGVGAYLDALHTDILERLDIFRASDAPKSDGESPLLPGQDLFVRYKVNLVVDHSGSQGAPVIHETNPTYHNLVGRVEHEVQLGALVTNFTMIKAGALHRANGGYLMLDARNVLTKPLAWESLKRTLTTREISTVMLDQDYQITATHTLEPEPITLDVKVILIGDPSIYYMLHSLDDEFRELFKVKADFATHMDWSDENIRQYAAFIGTICRQDNLRHFNPSGVARVVEYGARQVDDQGKLATKFGEIVDLIRQASYWAAESQHKLVGAADVQRAIDEHKYRSSRVDEQMREMITNGTILVDTDGKVVGQVNALSVMQMGDYAFGMPSRVTARAYAGGARLISIDRETALGGPIYNKASFILAGYLAGTFAQDVPLSVSASITFEQLYNAVEGDSATTTELYALLSSLSGLALRQDLAVTGSMNQFGQVQAIGGVNEKIEGFFDICQMRGLTGTQGVLIPQSNVRNLMLRDDVVEAVKKRKFHIYALSRVEEGIELLTGVPAGERQPDGTYPDGTVYALIQARLAALAEKARAKPDNT
jgi:lon-related putative ATP-dependent protease